MKQNDLIERLRSGENGFFELLEYPHSLQKELLTCFVASNDPETKNMALRVAWRRAQIVDLEKDSSILLLRLGLESECPKVWREAISGICSLKIDVLTEWYSAYKNDINEEKSDWIREALELKQGFSGN